MKDEKWPALPLAEWEKTYATLHMWTQVVGKVALALTPKVNHWWNVAFAVTPRGLSTATLHQGDRVLRIEFDFIHHRLVAVCQDGRVASMALVPCSVAEFYGKFMSMLGELGVEVKIWPIPCEMDNPIPFDKDLEHNSYDPEYSNRLWRILLASDQVFNDFRSRFIGKSSPVHFFWGSFDLAVTRFSGRRAPEREGADVITREAYSHEVISHGFWPGRRASGAVEADQAGSPMSAPAFYAYTVPEPAGYDASSIAPRQAFYNGELKEWILLYDEVRTAASPEQTLLDFLQSTYEAGANLAQWDRPNLERR